MRRDIFLHFLNRDTREVFGLYDNLPPNQHAQLLRRALNAAAIICEAQCVAPPGFIVEDEIAFELAENQQVYLQDGLIRLPMREQNLADFAEKKRLGYEPMRDRYSGLFNDTRIGFLGKHAVGIIGRKSHITEGILAGWESGPQAGRKIWQPIKKILTPSLIDAITRIPLDLDSRGVAVTWSAIRPELPLDALAASADLRNVLQHVYFRQYCSEFKLIALTKVPFVINDFSIPTEVGYDYRYLGSFLDIFDLRELLFEAPALLIVSLRKQLGFIAFIDAYVRLAKISNTETDLKFHAGRARAAVNFPMESFNRRRLSFYEISDIEISELSSVLGEIAKNLNLHHGFSTRLDMGVPVQTSSKIESIVPTEPKLVIYVALDEELKILAKSLDLKVNAFTPEATGKLDGIDVAVLCPRSMGRVAAAVAMSDYLARRSDKPKLILIVGLAGGFEENGSAPGHIVVATKVVDLALRKVVDDIGGVSPNFRREDYKLHDQLLNQIRSDELDKDDWAARACAALEWPADRRPSLHYGSMASADEVVASNEWRAKLLQGKGGEPKLLGVEMEAGGICEAARKANIPVSMLRVVSDFADPSKADDKWRTLGMKTVADLLKHLPMAKVVDAVI